MSEAWRGRGGERGFTLIELLIAMTLVALLSVMLVGSLRFGTRLWETGDERAAALSQVETVQRLLRRQIGQSRIVRPRTGGDADLPTSFDGGPEGLRFTAPLPAYVGIGGLYRFELRTVETEEGLGLELIWQLYRPDRPGWFEEEGLTRRTLIDGIESVRFRYYGVPDQDVDPPDWSESWDSIRSLPNLVTIEIAYPQGDPRPWPILTVAPVTATAPRR